LLLSQPEKIFNRRVLQESGFPNRLPDVLDQQKYFDGLVDETNCREASDRLACLRAIPYAQFKAAIDLSPNFLAAQGNLAWEPMVDGKLFPTLSDSSSRPGTEREICEGT